MQNKVILFVFPLPVYNTAFLTVQTAMCTKGILLRSNVPLEFKGDKRTLVRDNDIVYSLTRDHMSESQLKKMKPEIKNLNLHIHWPFTSRDCRDKSKVLLFWDIKTWKATYSLWQEGN